MNSVKKITIWETIIIFFVTLVSMSLIRAQVHSNLIRVLVVALIVLGTHAIAYFLRSRRGND